MAATGLSSSSSATASSPLSPPTVKLNPATPPSPNSATFLGQHISSSSPPSSTPPASIPRSTPAIVVSEMKEKTAPTDSETALVGPPMTETPVSGASAKPGPLQYLSRRISGKGATTPEAPKTSPEPSKEKEKTVQTPTAKPSTASTSASTAPPKPPVGTPKAATTTSMSRPAQTSAQKVSQKKKRKRKGLAGFFAALGCLSAGEFEDDEKSTLVGGNEMTEKPGTGATKTPMADSNPGPSTKAPVTAPEVTSKEADARGMTGTTRTADTGLTGTTATTGTTVVGGEADNDRGVMDAAEAKPEAVILAPVEPVTLPEDETAGVTSSAVQPPGSGSALLSTTLRPHPARRESDTAAATPADNDRTETSGGYSNISESDAIDESSGQVTEEHGEDYPMNEEYEDEEDRLIAQGGMGIPLDEHGQPAPLLPVMDKVHSGRKCLVLDLDETLLHSSFKMLPSADFIVPVEIETQTHNVYVIKRPGVDHFLKEMGKIYEIVVFTASLSKYADPVLDILDVHRVIRHRLFRESCYNHKGNYVKDLSQLGREMENSIIIDNSPASYIFHPNNAVPVSTWFNDPHDTELTDLCPFLADLATVDDIRGVLDGSV